MIAYSFLMLFERLSRRGYIFFRGLEMSAVSIWYLLAEIGFNFDASVISDGAGMSINLGRLLQSVDSDGEKTIFELAASRITNKYFQPAVMLSGYLTTARSMQEVFFELPLQGRQVLYVVLCLIVVLGEAHGMFRKVFQSDVAVAAVLSLTVFLDSLLDGLDGWMRKLLIQR